MKTKWTKRLISGFLSLMMLVCLIPTSAMAVGTGEPITIEYAMNNLSFQSYDDSSFLTECGVKENPATVEPGTTLTINLPTIRSYNDPDPELRDGTTSYYNNYEFQYIDIMWTDGDENSFKKFGMKRVTFSDTGWTTGVDFVVSPETTTCPIDIDDWANYVYVAYCWDADSFNLQKRPYLTNFIYEVNRTVAQDGQELTPTENEEKTDVYRVRENIDGQKDGLTLTYNTSMDMTKLSIFDGVYNLTEPGEAWQILLDWAEYITDKTWVDLHFNFDEKIDMKTLNTDGAELISDMFSVRSDVEKPFEVEGHELIVHCRWDSAKANQNLSDKGTLEPMIYFNGVKVGLPADWNEEDTITITNTGKVDGWVYAYGDGGEVNLDIEIDGGDAEDTFVLTCDKESLPGMDKTIVVTDEEGNKTEVNEDAVAAGDTVNFELESTVPEDLARFVKYTGVGDNEDVTVDGEIPAGAYTLTFHDKMHEDLALNPGSIQVLLDGAAIDEQYYDVIPNDGITDGCTFEVAVDLAAMYNNGVITEANFGFTPITVNYEATLNKEEVAGAYTNTAWVVYPEGESEHDTVTVYTYGIDVFKYDQANKEKGLDNAEFALYGADDVTVAEDGTVTVNEDATALRTVTSENGGKAIIGGLDEGTYYLVETKAPDGYVKSDTPLEIVIPEDADGTTYMVDVNFANSLIPHTGGMGTTIFSIVGGVLIAMAGTIFVISRRKRRA